jgi:hypothetical protein
MSSSFIFFPSSSQLFLPLLRLSSCVAPFWSPRAPPQPDTPPLTMVSLPYLAAMIPPPRPWRALLAHGEPLPSHSEFLPWPHHPLPQPSRTLSPTMTSSSGHDSPSPRHGKLSLAMVAHPPAMSSPSLDRAEHDRGHMPRRPSPPTVAAPPHPTASLPQPG